MGSNPAGPSVLFVFIVKKKCKSTKGSSNEERRYKAQERRRNGSGLAGVRTWKGYEKKMVRFDSKSIKWLTPSLERHGVKIKLILLL